MSNAVVTKHSTKPILLQVPCPLLKQLDEAAAVLRLPRVHLILRSLNRELQTTLKAEIDCHRRTLESEFALWPLDR